MGAQSQRKMEGDWTNLLPITFKTDQSDFLTTSGASFGNSTDDAHRCPVVSHSIDANHFSTSYTLTGFFIFFCGF